MTWACSASSPPLPTPASTSVPAPRLTASQQAACARLLARWRQGPPPATAWGPSHSQTRRADEPLQPDGGARHAAS